MILVTGATGRLGSATIEHLLKHVSPESIVAFARDERKAKHWKETGVKVRFGAYDDTESLVRAMRDVEKILLVSAPDPNGRLQRHRNVLNAAKKAGVKHIAFTGMATNDIRTSVIKPFMEDLFNFEDELRESGMIYTILRNTLYTDGIALFAGENVFRTGIFLPAGHGRVAFALRREMGEAAANVLLQTGHENKTYIFTGSRLYSYEDVARVLSELSGKDITYTAADPGTFSDTLKGLGIPEIVVFVVNGFSADVSNGQYESVSRDLEIVLAREPASLKDGLKEVYNF
ncbi:NAD(P)H dehydrogenase (quinone) [Anseongella ginsenosidimutans]|uniref:NAD(P)H dehydrogenase (Quinone) n=1 Tax=Anseongella ginsenosidimutans TaxID=496056 RepID=A0A4R3KR98_9SPHI|nr:SDR family oxidoreductase [Anseongella ginsenosidimutans]QEC52243.1 SDR family oxidoreductase [Anseongella ginsenosidimutans]TCS86795.1 NAD(P)H dehydrogenase (quinone) [Anseongella ginsenosidimutans]